MNNIWFVYAFLKSLIAVFAVLIQKYLKFKGNFYPIITTIIAAIFFILYAIKYENFNDLKQLNYPILIFLGFLLFLFLLLNYKLISTSSHPGYFKILSIYELLLILIISYYYFNAKISLKNWIGFIFIIIGTTLIININN